VWVDVYGESGEECGEDMATGCVFRGCVRHLASVTRHQTAQPAARTLKQNQTLCVRSCIPLPETCNKEVYFTSRLQPPHVRE